MRKLSLIFIVIAIISSGCVSEKINDEIAQNSQIKEEPEVWIEIHDVSPAWKYWRLEQILNVTETHPQAYSKVVLFVIPNHGDMLPLRAYPDFTHHLQLLADKGYIIGVHGYSHIVLEKYEFNTTLIQAKVLIDNAKKEFEDSGMKLPNYFAPPGWITSPEVSTYLKENFDYVYYGDYVVTPSGTVQYVSHEYTAFTENATASLIQAKKDFLETDEDVFRLTIHLYSANTEEGLKFLDEFLKWVESEKE